LVEQRIEIKDIYKIFADDMTEKEFNTLLTEIEIDRKKTEGVLIDLLICCYIKKGLRKKHLLLLSKRLGHSVFRANHLAQRFDYLSNYVLKIENSE
jgi:hypothetical protein